VAQIGYRNTNMNTEWKDQPESVQDTLTAGELIEYLQSCNPDTPIAITNFLTGETYMAEGAEARRITKDCQISKRDMEQEQDMQVVAIFTMGM
jgi:hypothetical protein